jgi:hypothetical protein
MEKNFSKRHVIGQLRQGDQLFSQPIKNHLLASSFNETTQQILNEH